MTGFCMATVATYPLRSLTYNGEIIDARRSDQGGNVHTSILGRMNFRYVDGPLIVTMV